MLNIIQMTAVGVCLKKLRTAFCEFAFIVQQIMSNIEFRALFDVQ